MIFYNVKNKVTGNVAVLTKLAKEIIENDASNKAKYEILGECDMHGREFNYNNFLNEANGKQSITIGATKEENCETANGGIERIEVGPIESFEQIKGCPTIESLGIAKSDDSIGGKANTNDKGNKSRKSK